MDEKCDVVDVVMPMLGDGTRMEGMQDTCKPLYKTPDGELFFFKALDSLRHQKIRNLVLLCRDEYAQQFAGLTGEIEKRYAPEGLYLFHEGKTDSQLESFFVGLTRLAQYRQSDDRVPIVSLDCDIYGDIPEFSLDRDVAGHLFCFKHNNPNKCFVRCEGDTVVEIAEKEAISNKAVFGAYVFNDSNLLYNTLGALRRGCGNISDVFASYLADGKKVTWSPVSDVVNYGTREEFEKTLGATKQYKALMFDFDGTLFDTYSLTFKAYQLAYFDLGYTVTREMFDKTKGFNVYEFNDIMGIVGCDVEKLKERKASYYSEMVTLAEPNRYLLNVIKDAKIPVCLVTTSRYESIAPLLEKYDLKFDVMVTGEDVSKHKPDSECYKIALERLNETHDIKPFECLTFEDSRPGFVSARGAGLDCVMMGKFVDDCIKDMSGGSEARTQLLLNENNSLVVRKIASGETPILHLRKQYEKLYDERDNKNYVDVLGYGDFDGFYYYYDMPYIIAPNLYDYINKVRVIPELVEILRNNIPENPELNKENVIDECFERYVSSGKKIYEETTGEKFEIDKGSIPEFVNNFRLTPYHGDAIFENILIEREDGDVLFIDPVPIRNAVTGVVFDCAKLMQSLMGYEAIRRGESFDYRVETKVFQECAKKLLTEDEFNSLKFHTACLFMRRLKYQVKQDKSLVKVYGDIAKRLFQEFIDGDYELI